MALTDRQRRFAQEYLVDLNASAAYRRTGYTGKAASTNACVMMRRPEVRRFIEKEMDRRAKRVEITQDRVVNELARMAFANAADVIDSCTGELKTGGEGAGTPAIAQLKFKKVNGETEWIGDIKLYDKLKALELLGKHLGVFSGGNQMAEAEKLPVIVDDI